MSLFQSTMTSVCFMFHTCLDFTWFFWFLKSIPVTEKISEILMNTITHSDVMTSCFFLQKKWCLTSLGHKQLHPIDKCCDKWLFPLTSKSKIKSQGWEKLRKFIQEKFEKKFKNFPSLLSFYVKLCKHGHYFF